MAKSALDKKYRGIIKNAKALQNLPRRNGNMCHIIGGMIGIICVGFPLIIFRNLLPDYLWIVLLISVGLASSWLIGEKLSEHTKAKLKQELNVVANEELKNTPPNLLEEVLAWQSFYGNSAPRALDEHIAAQLKHYDLVYEQRPLFGKRDKVYILQNWVLTIKIVAPEILKEYIYGRTAKL